MNKEIHKYRTRYNNNLHLPIANLSKYNKRTYFSGIKVFNHLLEYIKNLSNDQKYFTSTLKSFYINIPFTQLKNILNVMKVEKYQKLCFLYSKCVNINVFLKSYFYMKLF